MLLPDCDMSPAIDEAHGGVERATNGLESVKKTDQVARNWTLAADGRPLAIP